MQTPLEALDCLKPTRKFRSLYTAEMFMFRQKKFSIFTEEDSVHTILLESTNSKLFLFEFIYLFPTTLEGATIALLLPGQHTTLA